MLAGVDAGEGPRLRALAGGAPVQLTGLRWRRELDALIRGAELLVHPSLYEGFGLVVLEAMARGTPVLAARATALPETGGDAAVYFDPATPATSQSSARGAARRSGTRGRALRDRGRERAAEFTWERTARETRRCTAELL